MTNFLIIEHDKQSAQNLLKLLRILGYCIDGIFGSAELALSHIKTSRPDIVLLNKNLSANLEAVKLAAYLKRKVNIPSVYLVHESDKETVHDIQSDGILGILHKPFLLETLQTEIKKVLSKLSAPKSISINSVDYPKFTGILDACSAHVTQIHPKNISKQYLFSGNHHETVLVVEDENAVRHITQRILTSLGYRTIMNSNGKAALQTILEMNGCIDLIILDMKLPEMDGFEFYCELQVINPKVPVLFVSGYDIKTESIKLRHSGIHASRFLQKPYNKEALRQKLDEMLHHSKIRDSQRVSPHR